MYRFYIAVILIVTLALVSCRRHKAVEADMVVVNAEIWTGNPVQAAAQALAVCGDTLVFVGDDAQARDFIGKHTQVIDAEEMFVIPGFIDTHVHFVEGGLRLSSVQLQGAQSPEDFINRIRVFADSVEEGSWITGGEWNHEQWGGQLPHRNWIDSVTVNRPVWIRSQNGQWALANTAALQAAGIPLQAETAVYSGIARDSSGELTGIFSKQAMAWVEKAVPSPTLQQKERALQSAMDYMSSFGITSVHQMGGHMDVFERFHAQGRLKTRIYAATPIRQWKQLAEKVKKSGFGDQWLRVGGLTAVSDGNLAEGFPPSHTAAFYAGFTDPSQHAGLFASSPRQMYEWVSKADSAGLQPMIHATGDRAAAALLKVYQQVARENPPRDRRFRIEHAQHMVTADIRKLAPAGIIASMQPYHAIDESLWTEQVMGSKRTQSTYAFRSLIDAGIRVAFGSDWFAAPPSPIIGIYAAVTRRTLDGKNPQGWIPSQKITVEDALRAYTIYGAYASFEEHLKGTLEVGKLADFVLIDRNLTEIPATQIKDASVVMTVVGGKIAFRK